MDQIDQLQPKKMVLEERSKLYNKRHTMVSGDLEHIDDVKLRTQINISGHTSEETFYTKGMQIPSNTIGGAGGQFAKQGDKRMVLLDRKVNHSRANHSLETRYQDQYKIDSQNSQGRGPTDHSEVGEYLESN